MAHDFHVPTAAARNALGAAAKSVENDVEYRCIVARRYS